MPITPANDARLAELVGALSVAADLGMGQPLEQGLRICLLALELGRRLGCDAAARSDIYYVALLQHLGCTANAPEMAQWTGGDEIAFRSRAVVLTHASAAESVAALLRLTGADRPPAVRARLRVAALVEGNARVERLVALQCEAAEGLAARVGMSGGVRAGLAHVYEQWDGSGAPDGVEGPEVAPAQRVVTVAHDAVASARLRGVRAALEVVARRRGVAYDPEVCDALLSDSGLLLREPGEGDAWERLLDAEPAPVRTVGEAGLDGVARAFADFTDLKVPLLMGHSRGVASLAEAAARGLGLDAGEVAGVRRAALLHDLGRLGVANGIWEKPGALDTAERERVRLHPYYTERILARASAFAGAATCAASHHERLDGSGYHRGVGATALPLAARVLQAADAYDAMTHARPQRRLARPRSRPRRAARRHRERPPRPARRQRGAGGRGRAAGAGRRGMAGRALGPRGRRPATAGAREDQPPDRHRARDRPEDRRASRGEPLRQDGALHARRRGAVLRRARPPGLTPSITPAPAPARPSSRDGRASGASRSRTPIARGRRSGPRRRPRRPAR